MMTDFIIDVDLCGMDTAYGSQAHTFATEYTFETDTDAIDSDAVDDGGASTSSLNFGPLSFADEPLPEELEKMLEAKLRCEAAVLSLKGASSTAATAATTLDADSLTLSAHSSRSLAMSSEWMTSSTDDYELQDDDDSDEDGLIEEAAVEEPTAPERVCSDSSARLDGSHAGSSTDAILGGPIMGEAESEPSLLPRRSMLLKRRDRLERRPLAVLAEKRKEMIEEEEDDDDEDSDELSSADDDLSFATPPTSLVEDQEDSPFPGVAQFGNRNDDTSLGTKWPYWRNRALDRTGLILTPSVTKATLERALSGQVKLSPLIDKVDATATSDVLELMSNDAMFTLTNVCSNTLRTSIRFDAAYRDYTKRREQSSEGRPPLMESESPAEDVSGVITWNDTMTVRRYGKWTGELLSVETRSLKDVQKVRFDESDIDSFIESWSSGGGGGGSDSGLDSESDTDVDDDFGDYDDDNDFNVNFSSKLTAFLRSHSLAKKYY